MDWIITPLLAAGAGEWFLQPGNYLSLVEVVLGLGFVIFVHELGHFLVAKSCGVKCEKFYVGFDFFDIRFPKWSFLGPAAGRVIVPRALFKFQWGETEYGLGIIPLGGYVKMLGQDDNPAEEQKKIEASRERRGAADGSPAEGAVAGIDAQSASLPAGGPPPHEEAIDYELDPRSYLSKPVWKRMLIIVAGVTMNLITAPIFAAIAFWVFGVSYTPTVIGEVVPGSPAWEAGLQPGDKIVQIGDTSQSEHLRFMWDLRQGIGLAGESDPVTIGVRHPGEKDVKYYEVTPRSVEVKKGEKDKMPTIGVANMLTTKLRKEKPVVEFMPAGKAKARLKGEETIVAVITPDGSRVDFEDTQDDWAIFQLQRELWRYADQELTFVLEEKAEEGKPPKSVQVKVEPNYMRRFGLVMTPGPISGVQPGSPAESAGFQPGDEILSVGGMPFGWREEGEFIDPVSLSTHLIRHFDQPVDFVVERGGKEVELSVTPAVPETLPMLPRSGSQVGVDAVGICYPVHLVVAGVRPGTPAAATELLAGDRLTAAQFLSDDEEQREKLPEGGEAFELDDASINWQFLLTTLQLTEPDVDIKLTYLRDGETKTDTIQPKADRNEPHPFRGFSHEGLTEIHYADGPIDAAYLGLRQTKDEGLRILVMLKQLVSGGVSPFNLGGPGTIFVVATAAANEGFGNLLIFFTFLSVNLAIVNMLPIPVLDGGHFMFLTAEAIRRKPVNETWRIRLSIAGLCFIGGLMLFVCALDITNITKMLMGA